MKARITVEQRGWILQEIRHNPAVRQIEILGEALLVITLAGGAQVTYDARDGHVRAYRGGQGLYDKAAGRDVARTVAIVVRWTVEIGK